MTQRPANYQELRENRAGIRRKAMDKDRIDGAAKQAKGSIKEAAGKVTGDKSTELKGKTEQAAGKIQGEYGKAKDDVRDALKR
jgi:uncharacterized protein YjbJ (UPF0337 family)